MGEQRRMGVRGENGRLGALMVVRMNSRLRMPWVNWRRMGVRVGSMVDGVGQGVVWIYIYLFQDIHLPVIYRNPVQPLFPPEESTHITIYKIIGGKTRNLIEASVSSVRKSWSEGGGLAECGVGGNPKSPIGPPERL